MSDAEHPRPRRSRPGQDRSRGRRRVTAQVVAAVLALTVAAVDAYVLLERNRTTPVDLERALRDFRDRPASADGDGARSRRGGGTGVSGVESTPSGDAPTPAASPSPAAAEPAPADEPADTGSPRPEATERPATPASPTSTAEPTSERPRPFTLPAEGVYAYATSGWEEISVGGARHEYPDRTFASVEHVGGCRWDGEHRIIEEHIDRRGHCSEPGRLSLHWLETEVEFYGQREERRLDCDPPTVLIDGEPDPGETWTGRCEGEDTRSEETITYLGRETLTVGGTEVDVHHLGFETQLSGDTRGTAEGEGWYHTRTGLPVRGVRDVSTDTDSYGGEVHYEEHAEFTLESPAPQR